MIVNTGSTEIKTNKSWITLCNELYNIETNSNGLEFKVSFALNSSSDDLIDIPTIIPIWIENQH